MFKKQAFLWLLVAQFWLSGLFVLNVIFLNLDYLDDLTLYTFFAYSIGSFTAGILSDIIGRRLLFMVSSALLFLSSALMLWNLTAGLILANLSIGPLNNLTFVFINENYQEECEINTVKVLVGWAASQITLGVFFLNVADHRVFFYFLIGCSFVYALSAMILTQQTKDFQENKSRLRERSLREILLPNQLKAIIGGSILMFMMQMFYYRTQFTLDRFGVSLQINTIIVGIVEAIANISFFKAVKFCRRKFLLQMLIGSLMALLVALILIDTPEIQTAIQGFMRLCDTSIMLVLGIKDRGKGTNYIMCFGVFGSALSGKVFSHLPFAYLEIFLFASLLSSCLMPQTKLVDEEQRSILEHDNINIH